MTTTSPVRARSKDKNLEKKRGKQQHLHCLQNKTKLAGSAKNAADPDSRVAACCMHTAGLCHLYLSATPHGTTFSGPSLTGSTRDKHHALSATDSTVKIGR